ncbi:MAG: hypothetical protein ACAH59_00380 [Pseudobdellovibrionaceae bacterium]
MRAFSFITTGGKASQGQCDGETKVPRKLKHLKEVVKSDSYMGSELIDPEIKAQANEELWKHFFKSKASCNAVLAKTPSSLEESQKKDKPEIPSDDSGDSHQDEEEGNQSDSE